MAEGGWMEAAVSGMYDISQMNEMTMLNALAKKMEVYVKGKTSIAELQDKLKRQIFSQLIQPLTIEQLKYIFSEEITLFSKEQRKTKKFLGSLKSLFMKSQDKFELIRKISSRQNNEADVADLVVQSILEDVLAVIDTSEAEVINDNIEAFNALPLSQETTETVVEETRSVEQRPKLVQTNLPPSEVIPLLVGESRLEKLQVPHIRQLFRKYVKDDEKAASKSSQQLVKALQNKFFDALVKTDNPQQDRKFATELLQEFRPDPNFVIRTGLDRLRTQAKTLIRTNIEALDRLVDMLQHGGRRDTHGVIAAPKFCLPNLSTILEKREEMAEVRRQRQEGLKTGYFELRPNSTNPLLDEAGQRYSDHIAGWEFQTCSNCHERRLDMNITPISEKCKRCVNNPNKFSAANNMDPGDNSSVPDELKDLTPVEAAAISKFRPLQQIYYHPGGQTFSRGSSVAFAQDIQSLVNKLPRRPNDIGIVTLQPPGSSSGHKANRVKILRAINILKAINPYYSHIEIDEEALTEYPDNYLEDVPLPSLDLPPPTNRPANILGTEETNEQADLELMEIDEEVDERAFGPTVVDAPFVQPTECTRINEALWPDQNPEPVSEFSEGFFTQAWPHLFPTGDYHNFVKKTLFVVLTK